MKRRLKSSQPSEIFGVIACIRLDVEFARVACKPFEKSCSWSTAVASRLVQVIGVNCPLLKRSS